MNTMREAVATKSGNPLCDKSHVELTLRATLPASETTQAMFSPFHDEAAA
jgi:hypothetical protein